MIELLAAISTLICVLLLNIKNVWGWPAGIVAAGLYSYVFFDVELYGQIFLQGIFILQSIYGWFYWKQSSDEYGVISIGKWHVFLVIVGLLAFILINTYGYNINYFDVSTVMLALIANWMLSNKILESWIVWIICDILMIWLCISQDLWWSVGLYIILVINASTAYLTWKQDYDTQRLQR